MACRSLIASGLPRISEIAAGRFSKLRKPGHDVGMFGGDVVPRRDVSFDIEQQRLRGLAFPEMRMPRKLGERDNEFPETTANHRRLVGLKDRQAAAGLQKRTGPRYAASDSSSVCPNSSTLRRSCPSSALGRVQPGLRGCRTPSPSMIPEGETASAGCAIPVFCGKQVLHHQVSIFDGRTRHEPGRQVPTG